MGKIGRGIIGAAGLAGLVLAALALSAFGGPGSHGNSAGDSSSGTMAWPGERSCTLAVASLW